MVEPKSYGAVKYKRVEAALKQIAQHYADTPERLEDVDITFEYLIGSFFPEIITNINAQMNQRYTEGYIQGFEDGRKKGEETDGN